MNNKGIFALLDIKLLLVYISGSLGCIGIVNAGKNNIANIVRNNLVSYKKFDRENGKRDRAFHIMQKRMEKDLRVFAKAELFFFVAIFVAFAQIFISVIAILIQNHTVPCSQNHVRFVEGALFSTATLFAGVDLVGILFVLIDKRQDPFRAVWPT